MVLGPNMPQKPLLPHSRRNFPSILFITLNFLVLASEYLMAIRAKASVRLKFKSEKQLRTLLDALMPEANSPVTRRNTVKLGNDGLFLVLTVEAGDTVALRSTLNAYLRWIDSTINVMELIEKA
jgi:tRNA threonylcarbamoyladenosine modification (KEOPS) complex  Pcc1 subunit